MNQFPASCWTVIGERVRGASHVRRNEPCQDAWLSRHVGRSVLVAVADGHGSKRCPFSADGAQLAVETALDLLEELALQLTADDAGGTDILGAGAARQGESVPRAGRTLPLLSMLEEYAGDKLPARLVGMWRNRVLARHLASDRPLHDDVLLQYGSTLLAALATEEFLLFLQIGDGDILAVGADGTVTRPLPQDERLIANETTSLCTDRAWEDVAVQLHPLTGRQAPALFLLATDGYANSFARPEDFERVGADTLSLMRRHGLDAVAAHLPDWLAETSAEGSGDDITVALLCRHSLIPRRIAHEHTAHTGPDAPAEVG